MRQPETRSQFARFITIGIASNALIYCIYVILTSWGIVQPVAVASGYVIGISLAFASNRSWTFRHGGSVMVTLPRYLVLYLVAYIANVWLLTSIADYSGLPPQLVQAILIPVFALFLFAGQRRWVFSEMRGGR